MNKLNEFAIESFAISLLVSQGYTHIHGPSIAPDSETPERSSWGDVVLLFRLKESLTRINPTFSEAKIDEAIKTVQRIVSPDLLANNEAFHKLLTEGINITYQKDNEERGDYIYLIDYKNPSNNELCFNFPSTLAKSRTS